MITDPHCSSSRSHSAPCRRSDAPRPHASISRRRRLLSALFVAGTLLSSATVSADPLFVAIVDDTYADGTAPTAVRGASSQMIIKDSNNTAYDRIAYLESDFTSVVGTVSSATLYFYNKAAVSATPVTVFGLTDDTESESTITWNNQPSASGATTIATVTVTAAGWYTVDVTDYIVAQSSDKVATFKLADIAQTGTYITLAASEDSDPDRRPFLSIDVAPPTAIEIVPITEDTFADGSNPSTAQGGSSQLILKDSNGTAYDRVVYIEADFSAVTGTIGTATLHLYNKAAVATTPVTVYGLTDDSKTEANITWNNQPSATGAVTIGTISVAAAGWYEIDVTSYLTGQNADKTVTFKLADVTGVGSYITFSASEDSDPAKRPYLAIDAAPVPATDVIAIVDDTYADATNPTTVQGSQTELLLKDIGTTSLDRIVYMKVDLSTLPANVTTATLAFYNKTDIASTPVTVYGLTDDSKSEADITWNNQPSATGATTIGVVDVDTTGWYTIDVTAFVDAQSSDGTATFKLANITAQNTMMTIASSEETDQSKRPFLEFETGGGSGHNYIVASGGTLTFPADANGYRIPDFSYAGYMNSNESLPVYGTHYTAQVTLSNPSGDETTRIQNAINTVAALTPNGYGYRGAVVLGAGTWNVTSLTINADGVVLRGAGTASTIIASEVSTAQTVGIGSTFTEDPNVMFDEGRTGSTWNITTDVVNVGDMSFDLESGHQIGVGDRIIIEHPCTSAWVSAIGGGAPSPEQWAEGTVPIRYYRHVTAVSGNTITVDAPVFYTLVKAISQCFVYEYTKTTRQRVGIENLTVDHITTSNFDNGHAASCIRFYAAENCWLRNVVAQNYKMQGISPYQSSRLTFENVDVIDPHGEITSAYRYGVSFRGAQLVLVKDSYAFRNRHSYIGGGHAMDSGNVFLRCVAEDNYAATEDGHQRWANGTLFDNCEFRHVGSPETGASFDTKMLWMGNHGSNSNGHGWASVTGVAYKCDVESPGHAIIAKPPTGMNYEVDCTGDFRSNHSAHGDYPGALDVPTSGTLPASLFEAQLTQRLNP